jgi:hypothetical protein
MLGISTSSQTRQLIASFTALGITTPKVVTEASERQQRIAAGVRNLGSSKGLAEAVARAIAQGADPSVDPEVQRILNRSAIGNIAEEVERVADDELGEILKAQADEIVNAWRQPFDKAAKTLAEAHTVIGSVPLEETDVIVRRGGDAAEAWGRAQRASSTIDTIVSGWVSLATISHHSLTRRHMILRIADVDAGAWIDDNLTEQKLSPWQVVCAGYPLSLPTPREYQQRIRVIEQTRAEREAAHVKAMHDRETGRRPGAAA